MINVNRKMSFPLIRMGRSYVYELTIYAAKKSIKDAIIPILSDWVRAMKVHGISVMTQRILFHLSTNR